LVSFDCSVVAPAGIEPASSESESEILSIEIRSRISFKFRVQSSEFKKIQPCRLKLICPCKNNGNFRVKKSRTKINKRFLRLVETDGQRVQFNQDFAAI
jgi:hypothetical protein